MTFIDMRNQKVRDQVSRNILMSRLGIPWTQFQAAIPLLRAQKIPMWLASKMHMLCNNPKALKIMMKDSSAGGSWNSAAFMASHAGYRALVEPEEFNVCPVLLTQPKEDPWTPKWVSDLFLERIKKVSVKVVELEGAGHYPFEEPGLQQMVDAIVAFLKEVSS
jgi:alpha-beta hydrolase superfamily lysophospholipase